MLHNQMMAIITTKLNGSLQLSSMFMYLIHTVHVILVRHLYWSVLYLSTHVPITQSAYRMQQTIHTGCTDSYVAGTQHSCSGLGWGRRQRTFHLKLHVPTFRDKVNKNYIRVDQNLRRPPSPRNHTMSCWLHHDSISEVHVAIIIMVVGECFGAKGTTPCQESNLNIIVLCLS